MNPDCPYVDCSHCGQRLWHTLAFPVEKYYGNTIGMKTVYFCGEAHANEFYLEELRKVQE